MPINLQFWTMHRRAKTEADKTLRVSDDPCAASLFLPLFCSLPQAPLTPVLPKIPILIRRRANGFLISDQGHLPSLNEEKTRWIWNINMKLAVKTLLACATLCAGLQANAPQAAAAEPASLSHYGLAGLAPMSNAEAAKIRGTGGSAATAGSSFISGMLLDGTTKSYIFGVDTNRGMATLQQAGIVGPIDPFHVQSSNLGLALEIENLFRGQLIGGAGGTATSFFR